MVFVGTQLQFSAYMFLLYSKEFPNPDPRLSNHLLAIALPTHPTPCELCIQDHCFFRSTFSRSVTRSQQIFFLQWGISPLAAMLHPEHFDNVYLDLGLPIPEDTEELTPEVTPIPSPTDTDNSWVTVLRDLDIPELHL